MIVTYTTLDTYLGWREELVVGSDGRCAFSGIPVSREWAAWSLRQVRTLRRTYPGRFVTTRERAPEGEGQDDA